MTEKKLKKRVPKNVSDAYALVGSRGGRATVRKIGKKGMSALGKKGAKKRWSAGANSAA